MPHVDHVLDAVINVPLARSQCGGVHIADHRLKEARLTLINHEVSRGPLLAPENLALEHPVSIPHHGRRTCWHRDVMKREQPARWLAHRAVGSRLNLPLRSRRRLVICQPARVRIELVTLVGFTIAEVLASALDE